MRTSEAINNQEVQAYRSWCSKHHVFLEGQESVDNANFVRDYFLKTWSEDITEANLDKALPYIRPHLKFKSHAYLKLEQAANGMTPQEADIFDAWMSRQRLESSSDQGMENATNILSWLRKRNLEIIGRNLDVALQNIICNGHLGHAPLVWKRITVKKQEREMSDAEIATWRSRAEGASVRTPSGLVLRTKTEEIQKIVVNGADGKTDWKATAQAREIAAARMMGR